MLRAGDTGKGYRPCICSHGARAPAGSHPDKQIWHPEDVVPWGAVRQERGREPKKTVRGLFSMGWSGSPFSYDIIWEETWRGEASHANNRGQSNFKGNLWLERVGCPRSSWEASVAGAGWGRRTGGHLQMQSGSELQPGHKGPAGPGWGQRAFPEWHQSPLGMWANEWNDLTDIPGAPLSAMGAIGCRGRKEHVKTS